MRFYVFFMLVVIMSSFVASEVFYVVDLKYSNGELSVLDSDVMYSRVDKGNVYFNRENASFKVELLDIKGNILYSGLVDVTNQGIVHFGKDGIINASEYLIRNEFEFSIYLPYLGTTDSVAFYDLNGNLVATESASIFSQEQRQEEYVFFPENESIDSENSTFFYIFVVILILVVVSLVLYLIFRKKK
jgi:hypothetical protein